LLAIKEMDELFLLKSRQLLLDKIEFCSNIPDMGKKISLSLSMISISQGGNSRLQDFKTSKTSKDFPLCDFAFSEILQ